MASYEVTGYGRTYSVGPDGVARIDGVPVDASVTVEIRDGIEIAEAEEIVRRALEAGEDPVGLTCVETVTYAA